MDAGCAGRQSRVPDGAQCRGGLLRLQRGSASTHRKCAWRKLENAGQLLSQLPWHSAPISLEKADVGLRHAKPVGQLGLGPLPVTTSTAKVSAAHGRDYNTCCYIEREGNRATVAQCAETLRGQGGEHPPGDRRRPTGSPHRDRTHRARAMRPTRDATPCTNVAPTAAATRPVNPARAVKLNWTLASAGTVYNTIPSLGDGHWRHARKRPDRFQDRRSGDPRAHQNRLIPDTTVDVRFETMMPPMPFAPASMPLAEHVQRLYADAGGTPKINHVSTGARTDAAYAALETKAPVIEGMGLRNFGAHTNNAEYINISCRSSRVSIY